MAHPGIFVLFVFIACVLAIISMLVGSHFEVTRKLRSACGFWFFGLVSGFIIGVITVVGAILAMKH